VPGTAVLEIGFDRCLAFSSSLSSASLVSAVLNDAGFFGSMGFSIFFFFSSSSLFTRAIFVFKGYTRISKTQQMNEGKVWACALLKHSIQSSECKS
jgi:hypothetical protein